MPKSIKLFESDVKCGHRAAQYKHAMWLHEGRGNITVDKIKAEKWPTLSVVQGFEPAIRRLQQLN